LEVFLVSERSTHIPTTRQVPGPVRHLVPRPRAPLSPLRRPEAAAGPLPYDAELLERTLGFSGSYVSDDGNVTVRRAGVGAFEYTGDRYVGRCGICARRLELPVIEEPLADVAATIRFVSVHSHGDVD
jgi:hypothetical protein